MKIFLMDKFVIAPGVINPASTCQQQIMVVTGAVASPPLAPSTSEKGS
jgi:hypothetical protein